MINTKLKFTTDVFKNDKQTCMVAFCNITPTEYRIIIYLTGGSRLHIWLCTDHFILMPSGLTVQ